MLPATRPHVRAPLTHSTGSTKPSHRPDRSHGVGASTLAGSQRELSASPALEQIQRERSRIIHGRFWYRLLAGPPRAAVLGPVQPMAALLFG